MKYISRIFLLLCVAALMAGCKLAVIVVEGGEVQSDNSGDCEVNSVCLIEVTSTDFNDAFWPAEEAGWYFDSWVAGDGFLCGGSTYQTCALNLRPHKGNEAIEELVTSPTTFYLMPKFLPIRIDEVIAEGRTVKIGGRQWIQPLDTVGYSYNQIQEICPDRLCAGTLLNGNPGSPGAVIDIEGYIWASSEDMHWLAREYRSIGRDPYTDFEVDTTSRPALLTGMVSDAPSNQSSIYIALLGSSAEILQYPRRPDQVAYIGVWLWRPSE